MRAKYIDKWMIKVYVNMYLNPIIATQCHSSIDWNLDEHMYKRCQGVQNSSSHFKYGSLCLLNMIDKSSDGYVHTRIKDPNPGY